MPALLDVSTPDVASQPVAVASVATKESAPPPDPPLVANVSGTPKVPVVEVMASAPCEPCPTRKDCVTSGAGANTAFPGSSKWRVQVPVPTKLTLPVMY